MPDRMRSQQITSQEEKLAEEVTLHVAVNSGNLAVLQQFIAQNNQKAFDDALVTPDPNNGGYTPFYLAMLNPDKAMFNALTYRASTDAIDKALVQENKWGDTGLHCAVRRLDADTLHELIRKASQETFDKIVTTPNREGCTPFFLALSDPNTAIYAVLINRASSRQINGEVIRSYPKPALTSCDLFLMSAPPNQRYKISNKNRLYLYKDNNEAIFYYYYNYEREQKMEGAGKIPLEDKNNKLSEDIKNRLNFDQLPYIPERSSDYTIIKAIVEIVSNQGRIPLIIPYNDLDAVILNMETHLSCAVINNSDPEVFQALIDKVDQPVLDRELVKSNYGGRTLLHLGMLTYYTNAAGKKLTLQSQFLAEKTKILFAAASPDAINEVLGIPDAEGNTLLHLANEHPDKTLFPALYKIARPDTIKALAITNTSEKPVLYLLAIRAECRATFEACVQSARPEVISKTLAYAMKTQNKAIFHDLMTRVAPDVINQALLLRVDNDRNTLLHLAVYLKSYDSFQKLFKIATSETMSQLIIMSNARQATLLHLDFEYEHRLFSEMLLEEKRDLDPRVVNQALAIKNSAGRTPLYMAKTRFLVAFLPIVSSEIINNELGMDDLYSLEFLLCESNSLAKEIFEQRIQREATPEATSKALIQLIKNRRKPFFSKLISLIPPEIINQALVIANSSGDTPVHLAVAASDNMYLDSFMSRATSNVIGKALGMRNSEGYTPLYSATRRLSSAVFEKLIHMAPLALLQEQVNVNYITQLPNEYHQVNEVQVNAANLNEMARFVREPLESVKENFSNFAVLCETHVIKKIEILPVADLRTWINVLEKARLGVIKARDSIVDSELVHNRLCVFLMKINFHLYQHERDEEGKINAIKFALIVTSVDSIRDRLSLEECRLSAEMLILIDNLSYVELASIEAMLTDTGRSDINQPLSVVGAENQYLKVCSLRDLAKLKRLQYLHSVIKKSNGSSATSTKESGSSNENNQESKNENAENELSLDQPVTASAGSADDDDCPEITVLNALAIAILQNSDECKIGEEVASATTVDEGFYEDAMEILQKRILIPLPWGFSQLSKPSPSPPSPLAACSLFAESSVVPSTRFSSSSEHGYHFTFHIIQ